MSIIESIPVPLVFLLYLERLPKGTELMPGTSVPANVAKSSSSVWLCAAAGDDFCNEVHERFIALLRAAWISSWIAWSQTLSEIASGAFIISVWLEVEHFTPKHKLFDVKEERDARASLPELL